MAKTKLVRPQCLALILCDAVIEDSRTRNKSLINMFSGILSPNVPVRHDKMCVFAVFNGGRNRVPITLRLCRDDAYETDLLSMGGEVFFPPDRPRTVVDMVFEVRGFVFPKFGDYIFELICDEVPLMARRFSVNQAAPNPPAEPPPED